MKIWKLVSGILSIIFSMVIFFQSMAAGLSNALLDNGEISGTFGMFVGILILTAGIVSIVIRKSLKIEGDIALIILFGIGALIGISLAGSYSDLKIWGGWGLICMVLALISAISKSVRKNT